MDTHLKDTRFVEHKTLYIGWEELESLIQELLNDTTISLSNDESWYYEASSEKENETYSDSDLLGKIGDYLGESFDSSHVDEHGVWFVISKNVV